MTKENYKMDKIDNIDSTRMFADIQHLISQMGKDIMSLKKEVGTLSDQIGPTAIHTALNERKQLEEDYAMKLGLLHGMNIKIQSYTNFMASTKARLLKEVYQEKDKDGKIKHTNQEKRELRTQELCWQDDEWAKSKNEVDNLENDKILLNNQITIIKVGLKRCELTILAGVRR